MQPCLLRAVRGISQNGFGFLYDLVGGLLVGLRRGEFKVVAGQRYATTARVVKPSPRIRFSILTSRLR